MPEFIPLTCNNYGGKQQIDPSSERWVCEYCGTEFIMEQTLDVDEFVGTSKIIRSELALKRLAEELSDVDNAKSSELDSVYRKVNQAKTSLSKEKGEIHREKEAVHLPDDKLIPPIISRLFLLFILIFICILFSDPQYTEFNLSTVKEAIMSNPPIYIVLFLFIAFFLGRVIGKVLSKNRYSKKMREYEFEGQTLEGETEEKVKEIEKELDEINVKYEKPLDELKKQIDHHTKIVHGK